MTDSTERDQLIDLLHHPRRAEHLEDLEEHLTVASRLGRALWELLSNEGFGSGGDDRSRLAAMELADIVADHTTAAMYMFCKEACAAAPVENKTATL